MCGARKQASTRARARARFVAGSGDAPSPHSRTASAPLPSFLSCALLSPSPPFSKFPPCGGGRQRGWLPRRLSWWRGGEMGRGVGAARGNRELEGGGGEEGRHRHTHARSGEGTLDFSGYNTRFFFRTPILPVKNFRAWFCGFPKSWVSSKTGFAVKTMFPENTKNSSAAFSPGSSLVHSLRDW